MKFFHLILFLFLFTKQSVAQQNHFIYIQTENKQPFYVKLADRLLSSSSTGYLVISKLQDGIYDLYIGFPKNEWPLQKITVAIKNKDLGYVLKNFDSKGWGLFNMQTMDVIMSSSGNSTKDQNKESSSDGFADVLADVVSTPSIKQRPVEVKEEKKEVTEQKPVIEMKEEKVVAEPLRPAVKLFSTTDATGLAMAFVDSFDNRLDTIRIFIPNITVAEATVTTEKTVQPVEIAKKEEPKKDIPQEIKKETKKDEKFLDMELPNPNSKTDSVVSTNKMVVSAETDKKKIETPVTDKDAVVIRNESKAVVMINSDCRTTASEDDFLKLRKKMAAEKTDDEMIVVAKKALKAKCYSTEQVDNLSTLFLKDEGKYNFFDAAYPRVSDTQNFDRLVSKLTDEYYITRFKAMIRH